MVVGGVAMSGPASQDCQSSQLTLSVKTRRERERERELSGNNNGGHLVV